MSSTTFFFSEAVAVTASGVCCWCFTITLLVDSMAASRTNAKGKSRVERTK